MADQVTNVTVAQGAVVVSPATYSLTGRIYPNRLHDPDRTESPPLKDIVIRSLRGPEETILSLQSSRSRLARRQGGAAGLREIADPSDS